MGNSFQSCCKVGEEFEELNEENGDSGLKLVFAEDGVHLKELAKPPKSTIDYNGSVESLGHQKQSESEYHLKVNPEQPVPNSYSQPVQDEISQPVQNGFSKPLQSRDTQVVPNEYFIFIATKRLKLLHRRYEELAEKFNNAPELDRGSVLDSFNEAREAFSSACAMAEGISTDFNSLHHLVDLALDKIESTMLKLIETRQTNEEPERLQREFYIRQLKLIIKLQAQVRGYLTRTAYQKMLLQKELFHQIFYFDLATRMILAANLNVLHAVYKTYMTYPEQAFDKKCAMTFALHFEVVPKICNKRQLDTVFADTTSRNVTRGEDAVMSFVQFMKMLILLCLRFMKDDGYAMERLSKLFYIMDRSEGRKNASKQRHATGIGRFVLIGSEKMSLSSQQMRNLDLENLIDTTREFSPMRQRSHKKSKSQTSIETNAKNLISKSRKLSRGEDSKKKNIKAASGHQKLLEEDRKINLSISTPKGSRRFFPTTPKNISRTSSFPRNKGSSPRNKGSSPRNKGLSSHKQTMEQGKTNALPRNWKRGTGSRSPRSKSLKLKEEDDPQPPIRKASSQPDLDETNTVPSRISKTRTPTLGKNEKMTQGTKIPRSKSFGRVESNNQNSEDGKLLSKSRSYHKDNSSSLLPRKSSKGRSSLPISLKRENREKIHTQNSKIF